MSIDRKRAVVTGAARGIGRAVVHRLLSEGLEVLAVDVDAAGLGELEAAGAQVLAADLTDPVGVARVADAGDGAAYLANCHGIIRLCPLLNATRENWRDVFAVNAESVFFLCQALGPRLRDGGAIVNLSSVSATLATTEETAIYAASKSAVLAITRSFARLLASRGIRVNAILPGIIDTPMQDIVLEDVARLRGTTVAELAEGRTASVPMRRAATAEECAGGVWLLLSDDSSYMTGEAMNFSGGMSMW